MDFFLPLEEFLPNTPAPQAWQIESNTVNFFDAIPLKKMHPST
jgi:hypothetical protein